MKTALLLLIIVIILIIAIYIWEFYYGRNKNTPMLSKPTIPLGHFPFKIENGGVTLKQWYDSGKKSGHKIIRYYAGIRPWFLVIDPQYIKYIIQTDFEHFSDRGLYCNEKDDILSANLFAIGGGKWHFLRKKLTPTFTAGKLKGMFETLLQCGYHLEEAIENMANDGKEIDAMKLASPYSINVIGSCAFGIECNGFKEPNSKFILQAKSIFNINILRSILLNTAHAYPELSRKLGIRFFSKESIKFFFNLVKDIISFRVQNNATRKDMMQLLIELREEDNTTDGKYKKVWNKLSFEDITAQVFTFFAAGSETSTLTLTYSLYELAINESIQNKLRDEIHTVLRKHNDEITYDALMEMKYMGQVIEETLRAHSPAMYIFRECVKDYNVPETDYTIYKGSKIMFSLLGLHNDPEYFPQPEKFDPERFSPENKANMHPFTWLPFGEGPRVCIGIRFAMMQLKVALTAILRKHKVSLNDKTKLPITIPLFSITLTPANPIYLNIEKISEN